MTTPTIEDAYRQGKVLMGRASKPLGRLDPGGPEDKRFRSFFGAGVVVVLAAWRGMRDHDLLPPKPLFAHYLWVLMFMCLYPRNEVELCRLVGKDAKTVRKRTWPFIHSLYEYCFHVVS